MNNLIDEFKKQVANALKAEQIPENIFSTKVEARHLMNEIFYELRRDIKVFFMADDTSKYDSFHIGIRTIREDEDFDPKEIHIAHFPKDEMFYANFEILKQSPGCPPPLSITLDKDNRIILKAAHHKAKTFDTINDLRRHIGKCIAEACMEMEGGSYKKGEGYKYAMHRLIHFSAEDTNSNFYQGFESAIREEIGELTDLFLAFHKHMKAISSNFKNYYSWLELSFNGKVMGLDDFAFEIADDHDNLTDYPLRAEINDDGTFVVSCPNLPNRHCKNVDEALKELNNSVIEAVKVCDWALKLENL